MANSKGNTVSVIDAFTNAVVDSIAGHTPQAFGAFIGPVAPPAPPALVLAALGIRCSRHTGYDTALKRETARFSRDHTQPATTHCSRERIEAAFKTTY